MYNMKKGRYDQNKNKKNNRDVISYEDMPLDDYEQEKTDISPEAVKKIIISICIALVTGLIVFAFANRDKLTPENLSTWWTYEVLGNAGNGYPVNIIGSEVSLGNIDVNQGRIAYASDTSFVTLNSTGSEVLNTQIKTSNPVLKSNSDRYLTYSLGGTSYQIHTFDEDIYSGETEDVIYTGDISSNGTYCLVTEGNGYLSTLYVFNSYNNRIFKYSFSEYYINTVSLNSDGTGCIASGITSDAGAVSSGVYVLDFKKEEPASFYKINGDSIIEAEYINSNNGILIGQTASYIFKNGDKNYITNSYEDKKLVNYCFNYDTATYTVALSRSGDGKSCVLMQYKYNGDALYSIETEYSADSISVYKGRVLILDGNTAYVYNTDGKMIFSADAGTGAKKIIMTSDSTAYVLCSNQIRFIDFNANLNENQDKTENS